jgi:opacity protein-like surface antigen
MGDVMKKLLLGIVALVALSAGTSALAADMPVKTPLYKAPPPVVFSWTTACGALIAQASITNMS